MRWLRFAALLLSVLILIAVVAYWQSFTPVTFIINGQAQQVRVRASSVEEALAAAHVPLDPADTLTPDLQTPLEEAVEIQIIKPGQVALRDGDALTRLYTSATDPLVILREAGVTLDAGDEVLVDGVPLSQYIATAEPPRTLQILHAVTVTLEDNGAPGQIRTTALTVGGALRSSGITLYLADEVVPALDTPLTDGILIQITRSKPLILTVDGRELRTRAQGATIGEVLFNLGVALAGQDYVIPDENTPFSSGVRLRVVRVTEEIQTATSPLPYETVYRADRSLPLDTEQMIQPGQAGEQTERVRVRYEDGREVSRVVLDRAETLAPQDEIIAYGTQIILSQLVTPQGSLEYWRLVRMQVQPDATLLPNNAAADPTLLPVGSTIYIENYGQAVVTQALAEVGLSLRLGGTPMTAQTQVYFLTPIPENIVYRLPERIAP